MTQIEMHIEQIEAISELINNENCTQLTLSKIPKAIKYHTFEIKKILYETKAKETTNINNYPTYNRRMHSNNID